jgi:acyl carrier protein
MSPKVLGAFNLHAASAEMPLDFFVLYSSVASLLGSAGQASYAASNAFLDALAHHRRARGLAGLSINWGPFAEVGMAAADARRGRRLASRGMHSISLVQGLASFEIALGVQLAQLGFAELDMRQWLEFHPGVAASRQWGPLLDHAARRRAGPTLAEILAEQPQSERRPTVMALLTGEYAEIMQFDSSDVDPQKTFGDAGLDSLMSLEFRNRLEARLGLKLTATLLFTYPTLIALADHLLELTGYDGASAAPSTTRAEALPGFLQEVELMSDDEAERLLLDLVQGAHAGEAS